MEDHVDDYFKQDAGDFRDLMHHGAIGMQGFASKIQETYFKI